MRASAPDIPEHVRFALTAGTCEASPFLPTDDRECG
jgi:hypothetical protein